MSKTGLEDEEDEEELERRRVTVALDLGGATPLRSKLNWGSSTNDLRSTNVSGGGNGHLQGGPHTPSAP